MIQPVELSARREAELEALYPETIELLETLCTIPAPSNHEEQRAEFVRGWWEAQGMHAEIDDALNVRFGMGLDEYEDILVVMAHTDTVFPDTQPMAVTHKNGRIYCPGVGDDTANLAGMLMLSRYIFRQGLKPRCGVLFVADTGEEGLGNLKGCRAIMRDFGSRVKAFVALDGGLEGVCTAAVGSGRYEITVTAPGGHSFADFGSPSAVAALSELICDLYRQSVPQLGGSITTYNAGVISGGTTVNAIAEQATLLYEYRSDHPGCMEIMRAQLYELLESHGTEQVHFDCRLLGLRPTGECEDEEKQDELTEAAVHVLKRYTGHTPELSTGSTDCNIPLSMGIPSVCFGMYTGKGEHTRGEWILASSLKTGLLAVGSFLLGWFKVEGAR